MHLLKTGLFAIFIFESLSAQSLPSNFRQPIITETIVETISSKNGHTQAFCKEIASAIQSVVMSKLQKGTLPTELSNICSCNLCTKNNPSVSEIGNICTCPLCSKNSCPFSTTGLCSCPFCTSQNLNNGQLMFSPLVQGTKSTPCALARQNVPISAVYLQKSNGLQNEGTKGVNALFSVNNIQNSCKCIGPCCCAKDFDNLSGNRVPRSSNKLSEFFLLKAPNLYRNVFV